MLNKRQTAITAREEVDALIYYRSSLYPGSWQFNAIDLRVEKLKLCLDESKMMDIYQPKKYGRKRGK